MLSTAHHALAVEVTDWEAYKEHGHRNPRWDSFVEAGFSSFESGNLGSAEMFFQRAIAKGCDDGLVYARIGLFYEAQTNYKKAAEYLKKAVKRLAVQYPSSAVNDSTNEALGRCLYLLNDIEGAAPYLEKAAEGENFTALYFLGQIARTKKDYKNAIPLFVRALKAKRPAGIPPTIDILIMIEIGKAYYEIKDFNASLECWNQILAVDPRNQTAISYKSNIERARFKEEERKAIQEIIK
jgi:tetratricopeptide (TPR) repeat protein